ncbi:CD99 antigen-like protein 2 [Betta splendens]|uniref:CD99 antigen-like protein 2 n=1 Tax=Betta splendens TaxID=158456 RepID=A0A6P7LR53_BETSP|nr:CD99 antigen-like protein 2 [Betta splendens]
MANRCAWRLCALLALLQPLGVLSQELDLADALDSSDPKPATPAPKPAEPAGGAGVDLNLEDFFKSTTTTTKAPPKVLPKAPVGTKAPVKPKVKPAGGDLDLADALDSSNDFSGKDKGKGHGGGFSDTDLIDVSKDETYKPDKGKGKGEAGGHSIDQSDNNTETTAEVGTIAGIASAVAMALLGAVTSYISYQKKRLCFSIQQSLNTDMVKAENPEAVVATEPQVQQTLLQSPSAEPPTEENAV